MRRTLMFDDFCYTRGGEGLEASERSVTSIVREMDALAAAQEVAEGRQEPEMARQAVRAFLVQFEAKSLDEFVIEAALSLITGKPVECIGQKPTRKSWASYVSDVVGLAWLDWARGNPKQAQEAIRRLRVRTKSNKNVVGSGGAIRMLTLYFWSEAVFQLAGNNREAARRFYKRALDLGSQFGTDSHPMISWSYAASFFEDGSTFRK